MAIILSETSQDKNLTLKSIYTKPAEVLVTLRSRKLNGKTSDEVMLFDSSNRKLHSPYGYRSTARQIERAILRRQI